MDISVQKITNKSAFCPQKMMEITCFQGLCDAPTENEN